jgi:hypothetical protein
MKVSRSTLLRVIRGLPDPSVGRVRVLGVDEFALRRWHHYGTVLVDLTDGHRPVDVLIGREAADFAGWLRAHPGLICRDRAGGYADGARDGAPDAIQVADRWHLWDNLRQHVERLAAAHYTCLSEPVIREQEVPDPDDPATLVVPFWPPDTVRVEHTRQRYDQTHELRERGLSMRAIARKLDLNFKTVRRYLCADNVQTLLVGGVRSSVLDSFKPYLHERLADGTCNATVLHAEIAERGYTGGYNTLRRYLLRYATSRRPRSRRWGLSRAGRRCGRSPGGLPVFRGVSTQSMVNDFARSAPAVPRSTRQFTVWPGSPG